MQLLNGSRVLFVSVLFEFPQFCIVYTMFSMILSPTRSAYPVKDFRLLPRPRSRGEVYLDLALDLLLIRLA